MEVMLSVEIDAVTPNEAVRAFLDTVRAAECELYVYVDTEPVQIVPNGEGGYAVVE